MIVLLTGSSGQLGKSFYPNLSKDYQLVQYNSGSLDFKDLNKLDKTIREIRPNIIINTAAYTDVDSAEKNIKEAKLINAEAVGVIAEAAKKLDTILVHYSTDFVFDGKTNEGFFEDDTPNPVNNYGISKLEGEKYLINSGCKHFIIRTSWLYSTFGNNFFTKIINSAKKGNDILVVNDQYGSPTSTSLLVKTTLKLLNKPDAEYGIYHVASKEKISKYDFASYFLNALLEKNFFDTKINFVATQTINSKSNAVRPFNSYLETSKIEKELSFSLPHWKSDCNEVLSNL